MPASIRWAELTDFEALKRSRLNRLRGATKKPSNPSDCHALVELAGRRARCDEARRYLIQSKIPTQANLPGEKKPKKKQEKGKSRGKEHQ
jgi:hypothetical protein